MQPEHVAQVNIARMRAPLESEVMRGFVERLDEINGHAELLRDRRNWFEQFAGSAVAIWRVAAGHVPTIDEAKERLAHLEANGPSAYAFTFKTMA